MHFLTPTSHKLYFTFLLIAQLLAQISLVVVFAASQNITNAILLLFWATFIAYLLSALIVTKGKMYLNNNIWKPNALKISFAVLINYLLYVCLSYFVRPSFAFLDFITKVNDYYFTDPNIYASRFSCPKGGFESLCQISAEPLTLLDVSSWILLSISLAAFSYWLTCILGSRLFPAKKVRKK